MKDNHTKELEKLFHDFLEKHEGEPLDVLNAEMQKIMDKHNNTGIADFEGLSPEQMGGLLYQNCDENLIKIKDDTGADVPIIKQVNHYLRILKGNGKTKLTQAGYLPTAIVKELFAQKYFLGRNDKFFLEAGFNSPSREFDAPTVELTNILCQASGLIKKRERIISLTKKGEAALETGNVLSAILSAFVSKFNWRYYDRWEAEYDEIGQRGAYYSIYLLGKHGNEKRETSFYANKYFRAFFQEYVGINTEAHRIYSFRTFDRFLDYFGFLHDFGGEELEITHIKKSELFDKYIEIK
jgi:hypothetical protein